ncbi:MAG: DUF3048 domain-containing protein [Microthrixaceae bacterium]
MANLRSLLTSVGSRLASLGPRRLVFAAPVVVVGLVVGVVMLGGGNEVTTKEDAAKPHQRIVSTSKGIPRSTVASTTTTAPAPPPTTAAKQPATGDDQAVPVSDEASGAPGPQLMPVLPPEPWPEGCCAALTNKGFDPGQSEASPAVAVKVSNAPEADPHSNLHRADLIYELRAEDVSRFIAVYSSRDADVVGPIRSARTADPAIIKSLGRPMLVFSGGNDGVMSLMERREAEGWLVRMLTGMNTASFFRTNDRGVPHNFYGHRPGWVQTRGDLVAPPNRQTEFLGSSAVNHVTGQPVKVSVRIGQSNSWWQWDDTSQMWLRFQHNRPHIDKDTGFQIGRNSVVILKVNYAKSGADVRSPEAVSHGHGEAWVFTGRDYIHGGWSRNGPDDSWHLLDDRGNPIRLASGPVYIGLTDVSPVVE